MKSSFRPIAQPTRERPHVEIRSPVSNAPSMAPPVPNAFAQGVGQLQKALADRELEKERAAMASDPWNGMRDVSPLAGLGNRLRGLFGPGN